MRFYILQMVFLVATISGLLAGLAVGKVTEYYTATGKKPVLSIVRAI